MVRKYIKTDRILTGIQLAAFITLFIIEQIVGKWSYVTLALKIIGTVFLPLIILLYRQCIKSKIVNILVTAFQAYTIIVMIVKELIVKS